MLSFRSSGRLALILAECPTYLKRRAMSRSFGYTDSQTEISVLMPFREGNVPACFVHRSGMTASRQTSQSPSSQLVSQIAQISAGMFRVTVLSACLIVTVSFIFTYRLPFTVGICLPLTEVSIFNYRLP